MPAIEVRISAEASGALRKYGYKTKNISSMHVRVPWRDRTKR